MAEGLRHDERRGQERSAGHEQRAIRRCRRQAQIHVGDSPSLLATRLGGGQGFTLAGHQSATSAFPFRTDDPERKVNENST